MHTRYCNLHHFRSYLLPLDMWNVINFGRAKYNIWEIVIEHHATYIRAHTHTSFEHIYNFQQFRVRKIVESFTSIYPIGRA